MSIEKPVQEKIYRQFIDNITKHIWVEKLPAISELCQDYNINPKTLRKVTDRLVEEGLVEVKHGSGTYIRKQLKRLDSPVERILLVVPYQRGHFVSEIVQRFVASQQKNNIDVVIFGYDDCIEQSLPDMLPQWDRVAMFFTKNISPRLRRHLAEFSSRGRLLALNVKPSGLKAMLVTGDNSLGGEIALQSMLDMGYKKVAFFKFTENTFPCQRLKGYKKIIAESGQEYRKIINYHADLKWLENKFRNMIARKELPEVIIVDWHHWAPLIQLALIKANHAAGAKTKFLVFDPSSLEKAAGYYAIVQPISKIVAKSIDLLTAKEWKCHNVNIPLEFINFGA